MKKLIYKTIIFILILINFIISFSISLFAKNSLNYNMEMEKIKRVINNDIKNRDIPRELMEIPKDFFEKASEPGELKNFYYDTYDSLTYEEKKTKINKKATVYIPYGYDKNKKYNVYYLMHGGWSNETTQLGEEGNPNTFKNVIDHMIEEKLIEPLIIVCPTYNNLHSNDSDSYELSGYYLAPNFYRELLNDLMPKVETTYSTYAESGSLEDLEKSREHRCFAGFSMGSVCTFGVFTHLQNYIKYFQPMSGAVSPSEIDKSVTNSKYKKDFFIYAITGTKDFAGSSFKSLIDALLNMNSKNFILSDNENNGNIAFRLKDGYSHDEKAVREYVFNGLLYFFNYKNSDVNDSKVIFGKEIKNDFIIDNVYKSNIGDIHFSSYIPKEYDDSEPYALFITLPGWEGLYFHGVGANLKEDFPFEARKYNKKMIIISLQLNDWGITSANETIKLTKYFIENYNIDKNKIYLHGFSGGGETGSLVMELEPKLYSKFLCCSTKWDGNFENLKNAKTPIYMVIGQDDSYYGSQPLKDAYEKLYDLYLADGLPESEITELVILDIKEKKYFTDRGYKDQHMGGQSFAKDEEIMGWLFK
ncbi:MAG: hypothetical protein J6M39_08550 [Lachnospiraceae bacterium]|nr:hypothetical protein [Lachnospiraceae bacterium]